MKAPIPTALLALLALTSAAGQRTYHLTLDESIAIARERSYEAKSLILDSISAEHNLRSALARYRTDVSLGLDVPGYSEGVNTYTDENGRESYYSERRLDNAASLRVTQPLPTDGDFSLTSGLSTMDDYNNDERSARFSSRLSLTQPLAPLFGYNEYRNNIRLARLNHESATKQIKRNELAMVYSVSSNYYSLLSTQEGLNISRMNLEQQTEAFEMSKQKLAAGLVREVDNLQMEVDLAAARNEYDEAVFNLSSQINTFKILLGLELRDSIVLRSDLQYDVVAVDPDLAVELALKNRQEVQESAIRIEEADIRLRQSKAEALPSANLEAYYDLTGVGEDLGRRNNYWWSIDRSFIDMQERPTNFGVGLTMTVPIFNWGRHRSEIRSAEAGLLQEQMSKENTERTIEVQVRNLAAEIPSLLGRLQQQERNIPVAEKNFAITLERYTNGDVDSQVLSEARVRLNTAYRNRLNAFTNYQIALMELTRNTFYDFRLGVEVE